MARTFCTNPQISFEGARYQHPGIDCESSFRCGPDLDNCRVEDVSEDMLEYVGDCCRVRTASEACSTRNNTQTSEILGNKYMLPMQESCSGLSGLGFRATSSRRSSTSIWYRSTT